MEKQIIIRHISPELNCLEVVSGSIQEGQFVPADNLRQDLLDLGMTEDTLEDVITSEILPTRSVILASNLHSFIVRLVTTPGLTAINFYPSLLVFSYES